MLIEDVRGAKSEVVSCRCVAEWWGLVVGGAGQRAKLKQREVVSQRLDNQR